MCVNRICERLISYPYNSANKPKQGSIAMTKRLALLLIILLLAATPVIAEEQKTNDTLVIAISADFQPFTFLNAEGAPAGMFVDIWRLWAEKTGKQVEFISSDWNTSIENLKNQMADIHSGLVYSFEHPGWESGLVPIYEAEIALFSPLKEKKISDLKELSGQTVAAIRGIQLEQYLTQNYPDIQVFSCNTRAELVKVTREGKAKAFVAILPVGQAVIDRLGVSGEFRTVDKIVYRENIYPGVLKGNTELRALVIMGFNAISQEELAEIEARWIPDPAKRYFNKPTSKIRLTPEEETWLKAHKTIRLGISPVMPPLKFTEKGVIKGLEPDYANLLSEYTGISFEYVVCAFKEMDAKAKAGETDMFLSVYVPERLEHMTFTKPFLDFDQIIVSRSDAPFVSGLEALKGKKIAILKGLKLHEKILAPYAGIEIVRVDTMEEMFQAVSESKADALISKTYLATYVMPRYPNLKIAGVADIPHDPYYYAVRKEYPELVSILDKAINSIPKERVDAIIQKWFSVRLEYRPNWSEVRKWALAIGGAFSLLLGLTLFWNRRLAREIDKRRQSENDLRESEERFALAVRGSNEGIWDWNIVTNSNYFSPRFCELLCYGPDEINHELKTFEALLHPEDHDRILEAVRRHLEEHHPYDVEYRLRLKNGDYRWFHARGQAIWAEAGKPQRMAGSITDITQRKQAEEWLREGERVKSELLAKLDEAQHIAMIGSWEWDLNTNQVWWSDETYRIFGVTPQNYVPSFDENGKFIHPDDLEQYGKIFGHTLQTGEPLDSDFRLIAKDGLQKYCNAKGKVVCDDSGQPHRFAGTIMDITERQQAGEIILRERKQAQLYLDIAGVMLAALNDKGHITMINQKGCAILGYNEREILGRNWFEVCLPKSRVEELMGVFVKLMRGELAPVEYYENPIVTKNMDEREIAFHNAVLYDQQGNISGILFSGEDITERRQGEQERDRLKAILRALIDSCPAWIACMDTDGSYLIANSYYTETFLLPLSQIEGHNFQEVFPPDLYERHKKLIAQSVAIGKTLQWEDQASLKENQITHVYGSYTPLYDNDGSLWGVSAFGLDITALRQAEQEKDRLQAQIQQAVKMQAVGTLAGGIAHEFNNLLGVIMGCAEMARDEVPADSFAKNQLDKVMKASFRVKDLVKQILTFSRQAQQKQIVANLCPLVKESVKLIQPSIPSSVEIETRIDSDCRNAKVDPTEIQQIVMNLCSNAVWAMKEKGTITISMNEVSVTDNDVLISKGLSAGDYVKLSFADTGCGMDQQTVSQIFVPFFTTKEVGQGTGMGLAIIYGIIESYGGTITVESEVGKGTTFHLYFPVTGEPAAEVQALVEEIPRGTERILLVDDEEIYASMEAEVIGRLGYDVCLKTSSIEALEAYKATPEGYDLIITDQIMPGLSGDELVKEIRAIRPAIPIILCTGYSTQMDEGKAKALGINGFAFKPMARKDIAKLIRKVLDAA